LVRRFSAYYTLPLLLFTVKGQTADGGFGLFYTVFGFSGTVPMSKGKSSLVIKDYTDVSEAPGISSAPEGFALNQNYPNPFNPSTEISFILPKNARVMLEVLDVLGRRIRTLIDEPKRAGEHTFTWDGNNSRGYPVASGMYFYRLTTDHHTLARKMLLLK